MADEVVIDPDAKDLGTDLDILGVDDDPISEEVEPETPKGKEDEEVLEDEEEPEIEDEVEVEEEESRLRPSMKSMIAKHPELTKILKDFPQLRDAYFREGKLSQFFPSVEDAEIAATKAESLDTFDSLLKSGSTKEIFEAIHSDDPKALDRIAKNILPTLQSINQTLFYDAVTPVIDTLIRNLNAAGIKEKDNNKSAAAKILAHFIHGDYEIPEAQTKKDPELESERKALEDEKKKLASETNSRFENNLENRTGKLLTKLISDGLDPNNSLSEFVKSGIVREVIQRVGSELEKNPQHQAQLKKLYRLAQSERYSDKSAERIISAYLSRAKLLIPAVRSKVKNEALGTRTKAKDGIAKTTGRETSTSQSKVNRSSLPAKPDKKFWREHPSDMDILK